MRTHKYLPLHIDPDELRKFHVEDRLTLKAIASIYECNPATIRKKLTKYDIPFTPADPWKDRKHTEDFKERQRQRMRKHNPMKDPAVAQKVAVKLRESLVGESNPNYKHGKSSAIRSWRHNISPRRSRRLKKERKECAICEENDMSCLIAHENIKSREPLPDEDISVLCSNCHHKIHYSSATYDGRLGELQQLWSDSKNESRRRDQPKLQ